MEIRVPYKNLKQVEMTTLAEQEYPEAQPKAQAHMQECSLITLVLCCTVAAGVQFGWALQLSLLTPYIQTLGIGHKFSSIIWLCGPITGFVVQPCVGIWSDRCCSKYGRRRPFIFAGSLLISIAVIFIGFSVDIGYLIGDTKEHCSTFKGTRIRAAIVFTIGFWVLDLANNIVQGPARALLADLAGPHQLNVANAIFCSWTAVGNVLGFLAGSYGNWHSLFPFLTSRACCEACGNLKAAFLVAVIFLSLCTLVTLCFAKEVALVSKQHHRLLGSAPLLDEAGELKKKSDFETEDTPITIATAEEDEVETFNASPRAILVNVVTSIRHLPMGMHSVLIVMALTWFSWFPFFLFDTDWMGREVYHGNPEGNAAEMHAYDQGVREGAFGLLLNSIVLGISSFLIEPMSERIGSRLVWALGNLMLFACMAATAMITLISVKQSGEQSMLAIKNASLVIFAILGLPLAMTSIVPFSITAELTADTGGGQGLAMGVLNLAVVVPQMVVSLGAGPWDALFGGGNAPAFILASLSALAAGVYAALKLPKPSNTCYKPAALHCG
ncbi:sucrose transport protein SUC3-like [Bidens hawaiensis]|uniref:sucrose transport protein SUC3-like n=1 Tax=Bidens hawaiensis TaxID=980011 RepID=UPI00404B4DC8